MSYVQSCVAEENPDDQAGGGGAKNDTPVGCFSPKSSKLHKEAYLTLLGTSQKDPTREACCGALQNLTANKGLGSMAMSQILVQKLGALPTISSLLRSPNQTLQKTAMCLLGNMSRLGNGLQTSIAKQVLPELTGLLLAVKRDMGNNDNTIATACNIVRSLLTADSNLSKKALTPELVTSLADLSENTYLPKGSKAASLLLYNLWNEKSLQGTLKKLGLSKSLFVNDITTTVHKSVQVIK
ncbi:hypothetical protein CRUP_016203 [Coryphaenoides rupestris]|nr:hypothetical protein CRUP_016203 [Coryphaenoides rupestris]